MKVSTNHFSPDVCSLADQALALAVTIHATCQDLERAEDIDAAGPPSPKWWWRLSAYRRATRHNYGVAQEVLFMGPPIVNVLTEELKEVRGRLKKEYGVDFLYKETGQGGLHAWLRRVDGDGEYEIPEREPIASSFRG